MFPARPSFSENSESTAFVESRWSADSSRSSSPTLNYPTSSSTPPALFFIPGTKYTYIDNTLHDTTSDTDDTGWREVVLWALVSLCRGDMCMIRAANDPGILQSGHLGPQHYLCRMASILYVKGPFTLSDPDSRSRRWTDLKIYIHPVPRNALNKTKAGFFAFQTFLYLVSFLVAGIDIFIIVRTGPWGWEIRKRLNSMVFWSLVGIFACLVLFVFGAVGTGGWTIAYIMQSVCLLS